MLSGEAKVKVRMQCNDLIDLGAIPVDTWPTDMFQGNRGLDKGMVESTIG